MTGHPTTDRLQDYLDDLLCREERAELETHLATCDVCTAEIVRERELQRALAALPRAIEPERDLLPGINAAIDAAVAAVGAAAQTGAAPVNANAAAGRAANRLSVRRYPLAAAALALIAITAVVATLLARPDAASRPLADTDPTAAPRPGAVTDAVVREVLATEASYAAASDELEAMLAAGRTTLDPATVALVERNLRVVERALAEAGAALAQDPNNASLAELLQHARAQKLELLRRATRPGT